METNLSIRAHFPASLSTHFGNTHLAFCALATLALLAWFPGCKSSKKEPGASEQDSAGHRGGIPIVPRGKVSLATAKGEKFLLEIEAELSIQQALTFYRSQLPREGWQNLQVQQVAPGLWGLQAERGMFLLTGRIKRSGSRLKIGFERRIRRPEAAWRPPVGKDVVVLPEEIAWEERVFDAGSNRVEIRGRSVRPADKLRSNISSALATLGWTVTRGTKGAVTARRKLPGKKSPRRLDYIVEPGPGGSQVRLALALEELAGEPTSISAPVPRRRPARDGGALRPRDAETSGAAGALVPVPEDLRLWPSKRPMLAQRLSPAILRMSFERSCKGPATLLKEVEKRLGKRGFKPLSDPGSKAAGLSRKLSAATMQKGKRLIVVIVTPGPEGCQVSITETKRP